MPQEELKKVTVMLPTKLLRRATEVSQQGITPTIRQGLEAVIVNDAYQRVLALRGSVQLGLDLEELRRD